MLPRFSQDNTADTKLANAKFVGKFILSKLGGSNLFDVSFRQFGMIMIFASFIVGAVSAFIHHVAHIVGMSSHRKMGWVNASRIVARVHDLHSDGNHNSVLNHPRYSVGHVHLPSVMDTKLSLATSAHGGRPQPTIVGQRFLNLDPKASFELFIKHTVYVHE